MKCLPVTLSLCFQEWATSRRRAHKQTPPNLHTMSAVAFLTIYSFFKRCDVYDIISSFKVNTTNTESTFLDREQIVIWTHFPEQRLLYTCWNDTEVDFTRRHFSISHHCQRIRPRTKQATCKYLHQWWSSSQMHNCVTRHPYGSILGILSS